MLDQGGLRSSMQAPSTLRAGIRCFRPATRRQGPSRQTPPASGRCGAQQDEGSAEGVGHAGEPSLQPRLGETKPSHPSLRFQLFDAAADPADGGVVRLRPRQRLRSVAPDAGPEGARRAARGASKHVRARAALAQALPCGRTALWARGLPAKASAVPYGNLCCSTANQRGRPGARPVHAAAMAGRRVVMSGWILVPKSSMPRTKSSKVSSTPLVPGTVAISSSMLAMEA